MRIHSTMQLLCFVAGLAGAAVAAGASPTVGSDTAAPGVSPAAPGVWHEHRYSFAFLGFTSTYSCDGLADKLKLLLIYSGARADAKVQPGACASGYGRPDKFARADLTFYSLTPTTVNTDAAATAPGAWRPVSVSSHNPRDLRTGDCELVEQFKSTVLPLFTTRNVENRTTCIPHQESGSSIDLRFDVFTGIKTDTKVRHP